MQDGWQYDGRYSLIWEALGHFHFSIPKDYHVVFVNAWNYLIIVSFFGKKIIFPLKMQRRVTLNVTLVVLVPQSKWIFKIISIFLRANLDKDEGEGEILIIGVVHTPAISTHPLSIPLSSHKKTLDFLWGHCNFLTLSSCDFGGVDPTLPPNHGHWARNGSRQLSWWIIFMTSVLGQYPPTLLQSWSVWPTE